MSNEIKTGDEIETLARQALIDKISDMVKKGKSPKGLTEDEHSIAMTHAVTEILSLVPDDEATKVATTRRYLTMAIRATKNGSQMRQLAEKRGILVKQALTDTAAELADKYA